MPRITNVEKCRNYRKRRKAIKDAFNSPKKKPKSNAQKLPENIARRKEHIPSVTSESHPSTSIAVDCNAPSVEKIAFTNVNRRTRNSEFGNPWSPDVVLVEGEETPSHPLLESQNVALTSSTNGDLSTKKKRKIASRISMFKCMMDSLTLKFMKYQTESDERMLNKIEQLENERTAMDERVQKMWMDFEERRLTDTREHEINVMNVLQNIMDQVKKNHVVEK